MLTPQPASEIIAVEPEEAIFHHDAATLSPGTRRLTELAATFCPALTLRRRRLVGDGSTRGLPAGKHQKSLLFPELFVQRSVEITRVPNRVSLEQPNPAMA